MCLQNTDGNHAIKVSEKVQRKGTRTRDDDDKRKGVCSKFDGGGDSASNCLKERERESSHTSYRCGGDPHCLTYTNDQFHSTTMEKVGPVVEQLSTEHMLDSGCCMSGAAVQVMHSTLPNVHRLHFRVRWK